MEDSLFPKKRLIGLRVKMNVFGVRLPSVLTDQVQQLLPVHKRQATVPASPPVAAPEIDVEQIVLATTKSVIAILQQQFQMPLSVGQQASCPPSSTGQGAGGSSTRSTDMDTSFDSTQLGHLDAYG
ncbi:hypothetical protein ACA910_002989 [Epithemia clementina (nom. ined.)]